MSQWSALQDPRIAVIGLGYVGLPLTLAFARHLPVTGFDLDHRRVAELRSGRDHSGEIDSAELGASHARFTADPADAELRTANVYIVAVPTPVDDQKQVDLAPLRSASLQVGQWLKPGDLVIYESTVYPGCTRQFCAPLLEQGSGLRPELDFALGYSPERINPGDRNRTLADIVKVTAGHAPDVAELVDSLYRRIIRAGTHRAASIEVAEAAKALENTQRDVNIALINEFAQLCGRIGLQTQDVLAAARSKWNFLPFEPGLVGGHCIGVDPYYLIHRAQQTGFHPQLIAAARRVNDGMSSYVAMQLTTLLARHRIAIYAARILVLGVAFKENCADLRNTRVVEIVRELQTLGAEVDIHDPWVDAAVCEHEYGLRPIPSPAEQAYDLIVLAVSHREFREWTRADLARVGKPGYRVYDIKGAWPRDWTDGQL